MFHSQTCPDILPLIQTVRNVSQLNTATVLSVLINDRKHNCQDKVLHQSEYSCEQTFVPSSRLLRSSLKLSYAAASSFSFCSRVTPDWLLSFACVNSLCAVWQHIHDATGNTVNVYCTLVKVLRLTWRKTGHFGDVPKPISWLGIEKTKPNTIKAHIHQSKYMYYNTK